MGPCTRTVRLGPLGLLVVTLVATVGLTGTAFGQRLAAGFSSPQTLSGTAGGSTRATRHGVTRDGACTGWIADRPNHVVELADDFARLRIAVSAPSDTTLVILGPDGARCSDDGDGNNPVIEGAFGAGTYRIYVGSYAQGESVNYRLSISTR